MGSHTAKAIEHIDRQIGKFEELLKALTKELTTQEEELRRIQEEELRRERFEAYYQAARRHLLVMGKKYDDLYDETEFVLRQYFPPEDLKKFRDNVVTNLRLQIEAAKKEEEEHRRRNPEIRDLGLGLPRVEGEHYIQASKQCISSLRIYRERIEVFGLFRRDTLHFEGDFIMGDTYNVGQAGAVGPGSHAHDMIFNKISTQSGETIDLLRLAKELSVLRTKMKEQAVEPEQDVAVGAIAEAETEAKNGHAPKVLESLAKAGKWALDIATQIGTPVAIAALKAALGMQ